MATRVTTTLTDDLTGEEPASTYAFGLGDRNYEIDLTADNAEVFRTLLNPYVERARLVRPDRSKPKSKSGSGYSPEFIRAARAYGLRENLTTSTHGRVSAAVIEAFEAFIASGEAAPDL